jgi:DNA processing protein
MSASPAINDSLEIHYALVSQLLERFSRRSQLMLLQLYSCYEAIFTDTDYPAEPEINALVQDIRDQYAQGQWQAQLERILEAVASVDAAIIPITSSDYPKQLREISDAPSVLYLRGNRGCLHLPQIAMVGSRRMTRGGEHNALQWSQFLAEAGFGITSGLAMGIDGAAHRGALQAQTKANAGRTIAVMATGIDAVYPFRHRQLAEQVVESGGALVTEFPPGSQPLAARFPQRNRIISGLSMGVLLIEAALKSGSLITARFALEQNREIYAIPGSIHNPQSKGCHYLIKQGAALVETPADIVAELQGPLAGMAALVPETTADKTRLFTPEEDALLQAMGFEPVELDSLTQHFSTAKLAQLLISLELKGAVGCDHGLYQRLV